MIKNFLLKIIVSSSLNAVREICLRCPLAMTEDLLRDLALYKNYKEKSVVMAARSLIMLYRDALPALLHKKDRGRPTEASIEIKPKKYGEVIVADDIAGAEVLLKEAPELEVNDSSDDEDSEWVDVDHSDTEVYKTGEIDGDDDDDDEEEIEEDEEDDQESDENDQESEENDDKEKKKIKKKVTFNTMDEKEAGKQLALTRIFTDEDFARIEGEKAKKTVTNAKTKKRKHTDPSEDKERTEFVKLDDIEMIYKKRRTDKVARMESRKKGQEGREKFGYKDGRMNIHCSKTNREKRKNKNFNMIRHKERSKIKKSFRDKQLALRAHLIKQKKMK